MVFFLLLLSTFMAFAQTSPKLDPDKFTVCAITINSVEEKLIFSEQISKYPDKFNPIVELTSFGKEDWFKKACASKIRCDQLIISGEYGGDFFSLFNDIKLHQQELEEAFCSKTCDGILSQPYEVFLLGCNTLATKEADFRTREQYLEVLLKDGVPIERANMVVEARYGIVGDSNKAAMQRAFSGQQKQLYGFNSRGPSGKTIKPFLENYFSKVSIVDRLEKLQAQRMMNQTNMTNMILAESLKPTAFTQCEAGKVDDPVTKKLCKLQDSRVSVDTKLSLTLELLTDENYLIYLPAINEFFRKHPPSEFTPAQRKEFAFIAKNKVIKKQIVDLIGNTQTLGLKDEWTKFAQTVTYITEAERNRIMSEAVIKSFDTPMGSGLKDTICSLRTDEYKLDLKLSMLKNKDFGAYDIAALTCLTAYDPSISQHVLQKFVSSNDPAVSHAGLSYVMMSSNAFPLPEAYYSKCKTLLKSSDSNVKLSTINGADEKLAKTPEYSVAVKKLILSSDVEDKQTAINGFRLMKTTDKAVHKQIVQVIKSTNDRQLRGSSLLALIEIEPTDPSVISAMKEFLDDPELSDSTKEDLMTFLEDN